MARRESVDAVCHLGCGFISSQHFGGWLAESHANCNGARPRFVARQNYTSCPVCVQGETNERRDREKNSRKDNPYATSYVCRAQNDSASVSAFGPDGLYRPRTNGPRCESAWSFSNHKRGVQIARHLRSEYFRADD